MVPGLVFRLLSDRLWLDTTFDANVSISNFIKTIASSHEIFSDEAVERGFAPFAEHGDLTRLTPIQQDALEHAIQTALADDDAMLTHCFNIKRNLQNNPAN